MYRKNRNNDPRVITAKFNSVCAETGRPIKAGDSCVYYPLTKKVYHQDSKAAVEFREWKFDEEVLGHSY